MKQRKFGLLLLITLLSMCLIFTGCSSRKAAESAPMPAQQPEAQAAADSAIGDSKLKSPTTQETNRKLIVKLSMEMRVDEIEKSISDTEAMAAAAGGYIKESYQNEFSAQITLMIPAEKVDTFTTGLRGLGKVLNSNRNTEDVTNSYFDTQIRIKNLEAEIETMRNLLQKQGWKVTEILEIEREIRRLTDELETLKGYLTNLDRQITYSEVRINFEKSQVAIDSENENDLGYKLKVALNNGVGLLVKVFTALLSVIAFLLPIAPIIIIAYFLLRKPIRRYIKKSNEEPKE